MDMIGDGNPAFELTGYENFSKGIDLTLGLGFELGHNFSMTGIFGFSRFYNSSTYSSHQDIHSSNFVHNTDGSMNYSFRELMTPVGTLDPEMEESIPMPDNGERDMYQWADINQYLNVLRLGVGLEYALLRNQKFNLSLGAHFATNKILCSSTTAYLYLKDDSDHMMADTEYRANMAHGLRNLYYSGALEISAQYLLSDNFAFRFGVSRSSSLSNLLTSPTTNTSLNYYSSNLGFVATF